MKRSISACIAVCMMFMAGNLAAQVHTVSYEKKSKAIGNTFNIAGMQHRMVKLPVRDLGTGQKFHVTFPASMYEGSTFGSIRTEHKTDLPEGSNITIDGFPAHYYVTDNLFYDISAFGGMTTFWVGGFVDITVTIDIGDTLISMSAYFEAASPATGFPPLTDADMGDTFNAAPFANWARYVDPTGPLNGANKWIDFIKVKPL